MQNTRLPTAILLTLLTAACNLTPVKQSEHDTNPARVPVEPVTTQHHAPENTDIVQMDSVDIPQSSDLSPQDTVKHKTPPDDLWEVIRGHLSLDRNLDNKKVRSKLDWFARNQDYLDRVAERASPYLYHIVNEIERRGLPMELALLPIVESAYQPFAHSPSRASGLWQFIPGTGKRFGLKQNWWYDGRRDIISSTDAACRYLDQLNQRFNGEWELALAAYNAGEFNIERAIKRNHSKGRRTDFWSLDLVRETESYVPSLLAIAEIVAHPDKYNIHLQPIANKPYFTMVPVDGQIDLARVADLSGLDMDEIYTLNPGFNRWATDPKGPHRLLLPVTVDDEFRQKLAALPAEERINWKQYIIRQGDTLGGIAARHRTSVAALKDTNRLRSNRIRAGKSLLIPVSSQPAKHYTLSEDARRFRGLKSSGDGKKYIYTVKRGDTLWDIGRYYDISVRQLCQWNGIHSKTVLRLGQKLAIYVPDEAPQGKIIPAVALTDKQDNGLIRYVVQSGDSLWLIARKYGVSVTELRKWNKLSKKRHLQPGQNINIYTATTGA